MNSSRRLVRPSALYNWGINLEAGSAQSANGGALDGDTAVEALSFWLSMLPFAPPEATASTWDEVASTFAAGRAAQGWVYGENAAWIATDETPLGRHRQCRRPPASHGGRRD